MSDWDGIRFAFFVAVAYAIGLRLHQRVTGKRLGIEHRIWGAMIWAAGANLALRVLQDLGLHK